MLEKEKTKNENKLTWRDRLLRITELWRLSLINIQNSREFKSFSQTSDGRAPGIDQRQKYIDQMRANHYYRNPRI